VTNQRHESVRLGDLPRSIISQLDGQHDHAQLLEWLGTSITEGTFRVLCDDQPVEAVDAATLEKILDAVLTSLRTTALLMA